MSRRMQIPGRVPANDEQRWMFLSPCGRLLTRACIVEVLRTCKGRLGSLVMFGRKEWQEHLMSTRRLP